MPKPVEMMGRRFGRVVVIGNAESYRTPPTKKRPHGVPSRRYVIRCDCGTVKTAVGLKLRHGEIVSCGCHHDEQMASGLKLRHGETSKKVWSAEYKTWAGMVRRCENPKEENFPRYGGRGIRVCDRWRRGENGLTGYECFLADMGRKPSPQHSIDRYPDNDGNYEATNCRWATSSEQAFNRCRGA